MDGKIYRKRPLLPWWRTKWLLVIGFKLLSDLKMAALWHDARIRPVGADTSDLRIFILILTF